MEKLDFGVKWAEIFKNLNFKLNNLFTKNLILDFS